MTKFYRLLTCLVCLIACHSFAIKNRPRFAQRATFALFQSATTRANTDKQTLAEQCSLPISSLPPPPKSTGNPDDDGFRSFRDEAPIWFQSWLRDSGILRFLVDSLVLVGLPSLVQQYPQALSTFIQLTLQCQTIKYGPHSRQKMDIFTPKSESSKGLVVVTHGGAWGSGEPWMYRLTAAKKLECGYTVAVLGYRTYPDATVDGQVSDVSDAIAKLQELYPDLHTTAVIGHSSGAHISLLAAIKQQIQVDALICVAGVYDIVKHYDFETGRGVERISPLKPANGHVEDEWRRRSPTRLVSSTASVKLPPTLLVHGVKDSVVPYTSALEFKNALEECSEEEACTLSILPSTEHAETALDLMVGGKTQDVVVDWLEGQLA